MLSAGPWPRPPTKPAFSSGSSIRAKARRYARRVPRPVSYTHLDVYKRQPDSGSTTQTHDAAGNVLTRSDARGKTSTYRYDALNRVTEIAFNDATPPLVFGYDSGANARGRLSWIGDGPTVSVWASDSQGRVGAKQQMPATRQYSLLYPHDTYGLSLIHI